LINGLDKDANDLKGLKPEEIKSIFEQTIGNQHTFRILVKEDVFKGERRKRYIVTQVSALNYLLESHEILKILDSFK
jgi:Replication factor-A C terminal domain.